MDDRLIGLLNRVLTEIAAPVAGIAGIIVLLLQPDAPERPTLVFGCLALIGLRFASRADRRRVEETDP